MVHTDEAAVRLSGEGQLIKRALEEYDNDTVTSLFLRLVPDVDHGSVGSDSDLEATRATREVREAILTRRDLTPGQLSRVLTVHTGRLGDIELHLIGRHPAFGPAVAAELACHWRQPWLVQERTDMLAHMTTGGAQMRAAHAALDMIVDVTPTLVSTVTSILELLLAGGEHAFSAYVGLQPAWTGTQDELIDAARAAVAPARQT